jgi:hypothetical protein
LVYRKRLNRTSEEGERGTRRSECPTERGNVWYEVWYENAKHEYAKDAKYEHTENEIKNQRSYLRGTFDI